MLTISGAGTAAQYQQVLRTVTYNNTSDNPNTTPRLITFTATDPSLLSNSDAATFTVTVSGTIPDGQQVTVDYGTIDGEVALAGYRRGSDYVATLATLEATGQASKHEPFAPLAGFVDTVAHDDPEALTREYPTYDPISTLPEEGVQYWRRFVAERERSGSKSD